MYQVERHGHGVEEAASVSGDLPHDDGFVQIDDFPPGGPSSSGVGGVGVGRASSSPLLLLRR
jgi:hypothetical protein